MKQTKFTPLSRLAPLKVGGFPMHKRPHGDEFVALAEIWCTDIGRKFYPTREDWRIIWQDKDEAHDDQYWRSKGMVPIGCGGPNARYNEHRSHGRLRNECAATLVAKDLGIRNHPSTKRLLRETLWADTHGRVPCTQLADLVKAAYRTEQEPDHIAGWVLLIVEAIIQAEGLKLPAVEGEQTLSEVFNEIKREFKDKEALEFVTEKVKGSMSRLHIVTELSYITQCLFRRGQPASDMIKDSLRLIYEDRVLFKKTRAEIDATATRIEVQGLMGNKERQLELFFLYTEDERASKAALDLGADIVLLCHPASGHAQIFTNNKVKGLNLANAARMFRWLELPKDRKVANWIELGCPGTYKPIGWWFYFKEAEMLLNSSLTHANPATKISPESMVEVLMHAFHPDGVKWWCSDSHRKIQMGRRPAHTKRLAQKPVQPKQPAKHHQPKVTKAKATKAKPATKKKVTREPDGLKQVMKAFDAGVAVGQRKKRKLKKPVSANR